MQSGQSQDVDNEGIQEFRIERGAQVLGTDGPLGTVELIVVDQSTGALQGLVVRGEAGMEMELPGEYLESATGDRVYLSIGKADLAAHPELAQPYQPELYQPVDEGVTVPPSQVLDMNTDGAVLTEMEADAVEIAAPSSHEAQSDDLQAGAVPPDFADEPTVVLQPGTAGATDASRRALRSDAEHAAPVEPESALPAEAAPVEPPPAEAVPLEAGSPAAAPVQPTASEAAPAATAAETIPLPSAAAESLFPGAAPLTPTDQAVADEARAAVQPSQSPQPDTGATPEPRTVPVLKAGRAGAMPEAMHGAVRRAPGQQPPSTAQTGAMTTSASRPGASGAVRRLVAAGILAGSGAAAGAYLVWRRRQSRRPPSAMATARARMRDARSAGGSLASSLRDGGAFGLLVNPPARWPDVRARLEDAGVAAGNFAEALRRGLPASLPGNVPVSVPDLRPGLRAAARTGTRLVSVLPDVAASLPAARDRGLNAARALGFFGRWTSAWATTRARFTDLISWASVRPSEVARTEVADRMRDGTAQLTQRVRSAAERLSASAGDARETLTRRAANLTAKAATGPKPRRAVRRAGRRARWFRRGLIAGMAWGILCAPESGDDARARLLNTWRRMQNGLGLAQPGQATAPRGAPEAAAASGAGTGPRPYNPAQDELTPRGSQTSEPLLQPRSEEPLLPPPMPEVANDEVPGSPSQI